VLSAVAVPVVAAGGITTARGMAAALAAGAEAVRVGTRFIGTHEALAHGAHARYVDALLAAAAEDTMVTDTFSVGWPDASHRVLRSAVEAAEALDGETAGEFRFGDLAMPLPRFGVPSPTRDTTGAIEAMALYAGQSVGAVRTVEAAGEVVRELVGGAERLLIAAARNLEPGE
jgi:nitronate monooxygenase